MAASAAARGMPIPPGRARRGRHTGTASKSGARRSGPPPPRAALASPAKDAEVAALLAPWRSLVGSSVRAAKEIGAVASLTAAMALASAVDAARLEQSGYESDNLGTNLGHQF